MTVRETLRKEPPIAIVPSRICAESTSFGGTNISKGVSAYLFATQADPALYKTSIWIAIHSLQNNPALWRNPDLFFPERFAQEKANDFAFLPFSLGIRRW